MNLAVALPDPPATPRPAASVLMLRDGSDGVEVFMATRHGRSSFMPGILVFPGGAVDSGDADPALWDSAGPEDAISRIACIRDAFEEAGILLARPAGQAELVSDDRHQRLLDTYRDGLCAGTVPFSAMMAAEKLTPAIDLLIPFARWTTPVVRAKRFDARFYLARAPEGLIGAHDNRELIDSRWITPARAFDLADTGDIRIVFATRSHLRLLAKSRTVDLALADARLRKLPVVKPRLVESAAGPALRIPSGIGYDVTEVLLRDVGD
jgi:8-oxo-dGTP pyrophosphatase MutT (NUDIX family)